MDAARCAGDTHHAAGGLFGVHADFLSLAANIEKHGVSKFLGHLCNGFQGVPVIVAVAIVCFGILMLTELTSNTATAATFLLIVGAVAVSMGQNPMLFAIPAALAPSINSGTLCQCSIIVDHQRPIAMVIPLLKGWLFN